MWRGRVDGSPVPSSSLNVCDFTAELALPVPRARARCTGGRRRVNLETVLATRIYVRLNDVR